MVRLLAVEGRKWGEWVQPGDRPPPDLVAVSAPPISWCVEPVEPIAPVPFKYVRFVLERRDGGGTYIYRRVTPLWP